MLKIGRTNTLTVLRKTASACVLDGGEEYGDIVLLDTSPPTVSAGEALQVFVLTDGRGGLCATTSLPKAQVGDVAWLRVAAVNKVGAFLDWGLPKDLLVPFSEQQQRMVVDHHYLVKLFLDEDNRIAASSYLEDFVQYEAVYLNAGQQVDLIIAEETELGFKAVVNHRYWGLLYKDEIFRPLKLGQRVVGYVKKIRSDKKIDLALSLDNHSQQAASLSQRILAYLAGHGGQMPFNDRTSPDIIRQNFGVSKKVFKQTLGSLYKQRLISLHDWGVKLTEKS